MPGRFRPAWMGRFIYRVRKEEEPLANIPQTEAFHSKSCRLPAEDIVPSPSLSTDEGCSAYQPSHTKFDEPRRQPCDAAPLSVTTTIVLPSTISITQSKDRVFQTKSIHSPLTQPLSPSLRLFLSVYTTSPKQKAVKQLDVLHNTHSTDSPPPIRSRYFLNKPPS
jgi:hypothetical protein